MKRIWKWAIMMAVVLFFYNSVPSHAADGITYDNFDYVAYANAYADVKAAYGYDRDSLYRHYVTHGKAEGREAAAKRVTPGKLSVLGSGGQYFDAKAYADAYPDVRDACGYDKAKLWEHYRTFGEKEGRHAFGTTPHTTAMLRALEVAESIDASYGTQEQRLRAAHDWIVRNTRYDYQNYLQGTIPDISYEMEGVFLNGVAVCSGYAKAYAALCYALGYSCEYVVGYANSGGSAGGHAWNRVYYNGGWRYVDTCWDDPVGAAPDYLQYDYFMISQEQIARDHTMEGSRKLY